MSAQSGREDGEVIALVVVGALATSALAALIAVEWPLLASSSFHRKPALMPPGDAIAGAFHWAKTQPQEPRNIHRWADYKELLPTKTWWIALNALLLAALAIIALVVWAHVDRWRARRQTGLPGWDPRGKVAARAWARPRDLLRLHDDRANAAWRRLLSALTRFVRREPRRGNQERVDSWPLGRLQGTALRSEPELHLMTVAPTRSGKTSRVLIPALVEHAGPAIVLSNKTDVLHVTARARAARGPVFVFAPMTNLESFGIRPCGWSPLAGCEEWEFALRMGRWIFDADPSATAAGSDSGGARFYNREAVAVVMPPLLHAAALGDRSMASVHQWLRGGIESLDAPREILAGHDANAAADAIAGVQALDDRPRSLLLMSAAQLVDAYRFPSVQGTNGPALDSRVLLRENATLYLIAPDSDQEVLAPIFGGLLGVVLRHWETAAASGRHPPLLKILADEAAHLAPLSRLPTYLAVSGGWGVRWCLVYQSLAQLRHRYGADADAILANVLCKLFLGPIQDHDTRRYLTDLLDYETVTASSWTTTGGGGDHSRTRHERQAAKVSAQRLQQLREGEAVLVHGRDLPATTTLPAWWERSR